MPMTVLGMQRASEAKQAAERRCHDEVVARSTAAQCQEVRSLYFTCTLCAHIIIEPRYGIWKCLEG